MERETLGSWHETAYVAEWAGEDTVQNLLEFPRRISLALVADAELPVSHVVDLGSGQGPYLELFLRAFPDARGTWVDSSEPMRELAQERLADVGERVQYVVADVEELPYLEQAQVVVSSRALHHSSPETLQRIYRELFDVVAPGGFFFNLDHCGAPHDWEARYRRIRDQFTGPRKRELKPHRQDYPLTPVPDQLAWLEAAGFEADVPWRAFYTALLAGRRPA